MIYTLLKENQQMGLNPESNEKKYIVIAKEISLNYSWRFKNAIPVYNFYQ